MTRDSRVWLKVFLWVLYRDSVLNIPGVDHRRGTLVERTLPFCTVNLK